MTSPAEKFFISKIEEGLSYSSGSLSDEERGLLRTPVLDLQRTDVFSPEKGRRLNAKCVGALAEAYARDTAGKNRAAALRWREYNEQLYRSSQVVLSGIVQNWYLTVGRSQEKNAAGCLSVVAAVVLAAAIVLCGGDGLR